VTSTAEVGKGTRAGPGADELDVSVGYPNVLNILAALEFTATFFIEGWNVLHHPDLIKTISNSGHEVGLHGWTHEVFHSLTHLEAERALTDAQAAFRLIGIEPRGFRAPGGVRGPHTLSILKKLGIHYDSSVDDPADATVPCMLDGALPNIPWQWPMVDYYQYHMHPSGAQSPAQLEALFTEKIEQAANNRSLLTLIFHANTSGIDPARLSVLQRVLAKAKSNLRLDIITAGELAERVMESGA
jgi:peptidoglycan/xylan/chitin deacetylase (PgdA/CDA1 family)